MSDEESPRSGFFRDLRRAFTEGWASGFRDPEDTSTPNPLRSKISNLISTVKELPSKRVTTLNEGADRKASVVQALTTLTPAEQPRVSRAIKWAHRKAHSQESWWKTLTEFISEHPYTLTTLIPLAWLSLYLFMPPFVGTQDLQYATPADLVLTAATYLVYTRTIIFFAYLLRKANRHISEIFRITSLLLAFYPLVSESARSSLLEQLKSAGFYEIDLSLISTRGVRDSETLLLTIKFIALVGAFALIIRAMQFLVPRIGPKASNTEVACAKVLLTLLELALWSEMAAEKRRSQIEYSGAASATESEIKKDFSPYATSIERENLLLGLEALARLVQGEWRRSMKTGDRIGDATVSVTAEGIAVAARRWKTIASVGGERTSDLREALALALLAAVDDRWTDMAAEISGSQLLSSRIVRYLRRGSAILVFTSTVVMVATKPFPWMSGQDPIFDSLAVACGAATALAIDPSIGDKFANAMKLASSFSVKK